MFVDDTSPTAKALLALELIQNSPGITGQRLGERLGVTDRAARRYVGILREAGLPIESTPGRYGGYRVGRGFRLPPLMFSTAEALGLMMAALEGHHRSSDPNDPAGSALDKIIRVLPNSVAEPAEAIRRLIAPHSSPDWTYPNPETTATLVQACVNQHRLRIGYSRGEGDEFTMDIDPWGVSIRHGRWYLLCWSHTKDARRVLRIDRVTTVDVLPEVFTPPADLDPVRVVLEHFSEGWKYQVEVLIDAPLARVQYWISRSLGRLEEIDADHTRLIGSTDEPEWYVRRIAAIEAPFRVIGPPEIQAAARALAEDLLRAAGN